MTYIPVVPIAHLPEETRMRAYDELVSVDYDIATSDNEVGVIGPRGVEHMLKAARNAGMNCVFRTPDRVPIHQSRDVGEDSSILAWGRVFSFPEKEVVPRGESGRICPATYS